MKAASHEKQHQRHNEETAYLSRALRLAKTQHEIDLAEKNAALEAAQTRVLMLEADIGESRRREEELQAFMRKSAKGSDAIAEALADTLRLVEGKLEHAMSRISIAEAAARAAAENAVAAEGRAKLAEATLVNERTQWAALVRRLQKAGQREAHLRLNAEEKLSTRPERQENSTKPAQPDLAAGDE